MKQIYCPKCKKLLFKADFANIEIKCGSCKRLVKVRFYSQDALLLTAKDIENEIEDAEEKVKAKEIK